MPKGPISGIRSPTKCLRIGIFFLNNLSDLTLTLGSTQPLTEMSTRYISWEVKSADA